MKTIFLATAMALSVWTSHAGTFAHVIEPMAMPLFSKPGEIQGRLGTGPDGEGFRLQGGYAVNPKLAIVAAGSFAQKENCATCYTRVQRHFEIAAGTYRPIAGAWTGEAFAGAGTGRFKASGEIGGWDPSLEDLRMTSAQYDLAFIQANVGHRGTWGDIAYGLRTSLHRLRNYKTVDGLQMTLPTRNEAWGAYLEPSITGAVGFKDYKLDVQLGSSIPMVDAQREDERRGWISVGMGFHAFGG
jgi:hypothetical protein